MLSEEQYLLEQIKLHIKRFFDEDVTHLFNRTSINFINYSDCVAYNKMGIVIPIDIPMPSKINDTFKVNFNKTQVTLWNKIKRPDGWVSLPSNDNPIWYINNCNTVMPAWNLYKNIFNLLTLSEEIETDKRDIHGRYIAEYTLRNTCNLLEVPAFNEACALLVAMTRWLNDKTKTFLEIEKGVKPPVVIISHDCDIILGNDKWTQAVRMYRCLKPITKLKIPKFNNIKHIVENYINPKKYYYDNILAMIEVERMHNAISSFYFLNGNGGRFGSRSKDKTIHEIANKVPTGWNIGIHYNYDTLLEHKTFTKQKRELEDILNRKIKSGRAHYLRFDPIESYEFLDNHEIQYDESVGYPDKIGYRCGIAGPFNPYNSKKNDKFNLLELPLVIMDGTLIEQYKDNAVPTFKKMLTHLSRIGGSITILWHPGMFYNPEFPETYKLYFDLLDVATELNADIESCISFIEKY